MLGFVNLFKPAGPSSTQFGARLRRIYRDPAGKLAIGHLGTLDPQAAGVLPVALGKATRLLPLIIDRRKAYACTLMLGRATTTGDAVGETIVERAVPDDVDERLANVIASFVGAVSQVPPMFSAVKSDGRRLYDLARA
ncbi:MAG: tRNA pseudouridine(55) synthase TruB, partial [Candidatus Eremiobacteraeota bacterium]|nr:tRNA pseudouridine(55) synthase TruB [Candidatus Eremiobacteraeota bacterium]